MTPERKQWWDSLPQREKMLREQIEKTKIVISLSKFALQVCLTDEDIKWFISRIKKKKVVLTALKRELDRTTTMIYTGHYQGVLPIYRCEKCGNEIEDIGQWCCPWCGREIKERK
jgi:rubrerythrin